MRTEVKSSLLRSLEYNPHTRELLVEFRGKTEGEPGKVYRYDNVTQQAYDAFLAAPSLGKHFLNEIKPAHPCTRIKETEDAKSKESVSQDRAPDGDPIPF